MSLVAQKWAGFEKVQGPIGMMVYIMKLRLLLRRTNYTQFGIRYGPAPGPPGPSDMRYYGLDKCALHHEGPG